LGNLVKGYYTISIGKRKIIKSFCGCYTGPGKFAKRRAQGAKRKHDLRCAQNAMRHAPSPWSPKAKIILLHRILKQFSMEFSLISPIIEFYIYIRLISTSHRKTTFTPFSSNSFLNCHHSLSRACRTGGCQE
jgi:hypothetical protein